MKITISKPEYQILSDSTGKFKVQMKGSDAIVPNFHLPCHWSDLDFNGECVNADSAAYFQSIDEAEEFIEKLELASAEESKSWPTESWQVVKKIPAK